MFVQKNKMLVLALQFSRGGAGTHRGAPSGARREWRREAVLRLLQNGREDRSAGGSGEGGTCPTTSPSSTTNPPVHQLGVQAPGDLVVADGVEWTP
jgi:hypothetical protein